MFGKFSIILDLVMMALAIISMYKSKTDNEGTLSLIILLLSFGFFLQDVATLAAPK